MSIFYFIVWGTKQVKRRLGYVADFCPICRSIQAHQVDRLGMAGHIYYIPFGEGKLVGYHGTCCTCSLLTNADPNLHSKVSKTLMPNLQDLIQESFPNIETHYAQRLDIEQNLKQLPRSLPDELRQALLEEPFRLIAPMLDIGDGMYYFDRNSLIGAVMTMVTLMFVSVLGAAGLFIFLGSLCYTCFELFFQRRRKYLKRTLIPMLAQTLRPLNPTLDELRSCLNQLAIARKRLGLKLKPEVLHMAILQAESREFSGVNS